MLKRRLAWAGTSIIGALGTYLAWLGVAEHLPQWSPYAVVGAVAVASVLLFPIGSSDDSSPRRLITALVRGRNNVTFVSGNESPSTGNIINTGSGSPALTINHGSDLTYTDVRQISVDASRAEVLPAARAVASQAAIAEIDRRSDVLTDKVLERINETDPGLFVRWDDPRFLAALTSAQRGYAETGDDDLGEVLASLVAGLASERIRSRREIILRQAIDVAQNLTTEHINALVTIMVITRMRLDTPYSTDGLINALDGLLSPFYVHLPSSEIDYQYMSSTGVCYNDQLHQFAGGPYQRLYEKYPNSMYPAFTFPELREDFWRDDNPLLDENTKLLGVILAEQGDAIQTPDGKTVFSKEGIERAHFRVAPEHIATVLNSRSDGEDQLSKSQKKLRQMVRDRSLTAAQFQVA